MNDDATQLRCTADWLQANTNNWPAVENSLRVGAAALDDREAEIRRLRETVSELRRQVIMWTRAAEQFAKCT